MGVGGANENERGREKRAKECVYDVNWKRFLSCHGARTAATLVGGPSPCSVDAFVASKPVSSSSSPAGTGIASSDFSLGIFCLDFFFFFFFVKLFSLSSSSSSFFF